MSTFNLYVKNLQGKTITVPVASASETIFKIKEKIAKVENIPPAMQILMYAGKHLEEARTVSDYNLRDGKCLHIVPKNYNAQQQQQQK